MSVLARISPAGPRWRRFCWRTTPPRSARRFISDMRASRDSNSFDGIFRHQLSAVVARSGDFDWRLPGSSAARAARGLDADWTRHAGRDARSPRAAVAAGLVALFYLLLNASYFYWEGGWAYAPRQVTPALPFVALGLAPLWDLDAARSGRCSWSVGSGERR